MSMLRTVKPKNARVKRALEEREPKLVENEKTAIFVKGQNTSDNVRTAMKDMYALKRPNAINFSRKNDIHPFEDASSLEFFAQKNDASLMLTGLHSKKRPNDLIFTRMFDGRVLDMLELGIDQIKGMADFASPKSSVGIRPLMVFHSDLFDTHPTFILLKSLLLDFYNGHPLTELPLAAVEHVISITAGPLSASTSSLDLSSSTDHSQSQPLPKVHFRVYTTVLHASTSKVPRLELTEMGPSIDFTVRRVQEADEERMKAALKRPKVSKKDVESGLGKKKKNIETDEMGDTVGRIHLPKQDLGKMQGRKMKGLKKARGGDVSGAEDGAGGEADGEAE